MLQNRVVARYLDGRVLKGTTGDFFPTRPSFHLAPADGPPDAKPVEVRVADLKAVFFVKDLGGDPSRKDLPVFPEGQHIVGRRLEVVFHDGETLVGTTQGYDPKRAGFFLLPVDPAANNERCFVVSAAAKRVSFV